MTPRAPVGSRSRGGSIERQPLIRAGRERPIGLGTQVAGPLLEVVVLGNRAFRLRGEIDISTVGRLAEVLDPVAESEGDVVLDLQELEFADSAGLRELIRCAQRLEERGRLVLRRPTPTLQRFFDVTGLGHIPNVTIDSA